MDGSVSLHTFLKCIRCFCTGDSHLFVFIVLAFTMIAGSCRKEDDAPPETCELVIGNYRNMIIDSTVQIIDAPYNGGDMISLDFDSNDTIDLRLVVACYGSPGIGVHYVSEIQSLNKNAAIHGFFTLDTAFLNKVISNFSDDYNIYQSITEYYSCRRKNPTDLVSSFGSAFHGLNLNPDDKLKLSDTFSADTVSFIYQHQSPQYMNVSNDTVFIHKSYYESDCHTVPYGKAIYLGFKFKGEQERLGWIKIVLQSECKITLLEYAIQNELP